MMYETCEIKKQPNGKYNMYLDGSLVASDKDVVKLCRSLLKDLKGADHDNTN